MPDGAEPVRTAQPSLEKEGPVTGEQNEAGMNREIMSISVIHMPLLQQVILSLLRLLPFALPAGVLFLAGLVLTRTISGWMIKVSVRYMPQLTGIYPSSRVRQQRASPVSDGVYS